MLQLASFKELFFWKQKTVFGKAKEKGWDVGLQHQDLPFQTLDYATA